MRLTASSPSSCSRSVRRPTALAGTFVVPFGGGTSMLAAGWAPRADAPAVCGFEGRHGVPERRDAGGAQRLPLPLQRACGSADTCRQRTLAYIKASAATALCAYSFAAQPGDTLRRCSGGTFTNAVATSVANWVELGLYNEGGPRSASRRPAPTTSFPERLGDDLGSHGARAGRQRADGGAVRVLRGAAMGGFRSRERGAGRDLCHRRRRARGAARAGVLVAVRHGRQRQRGDRPGRAGRRAAFAHRLRAVVRRRRLQRRPDGLHRRPQPAGASRDRRRADAAAAATGWWGQDRSR